MNVLELGPGLGLSTDWLRHRCRQLTCLEVDFELANKLHQRLLGAEVHVLCGSATQMPFADGSFNCAVCFTMLHHVPSGVMQDQVSAEVHRVLRFVGPPIARQYKTKLHTQAMQSATLTVATPHNGQP